MLPDTCHKTLPVLFIFKFSNAGNRQHCTPGSWFYNTHMRQCFVREDNIRRHLLLPCYLHPKTAQHLEELFVCLGKISSGKPGCNSFSALFLLLLLCLMLLFLCHFHSDLRLITQNLFRFCRQLHDRILIIGNREELIQQQIIYNLSQFI